MCEDAEALAAARSQIRGLLKESSPTLAPVERYRSWLRHDPRGYLAFRRFLELQRQLEENQGAAPDRAVHDEIVLYGAACLREGIRLPPWLAEYLADLLEERKRPPRRIPGPSPVARARRNSILWLTVKMLCDNYGLPAYSNNELAPSSYLSACDIVAEAACLEGISVGRDAVIKEVRRWESVEWTTWGPSSGGN